MRDVLSELVKQTLGAGLEVVRVMGTPDSTRIDASDDDKVLFLKATFKTPIPAFTGDFGMANLKLLSGLLNFSSYNTDQAEHEVHRTKMDGADVPFTLEFRDGNGGRAEYRFMPAKLVPENQISNIPWDVTLTPNRAKVAEFTHLANLYSEVDKHFGVKTDKGNLIFIVGGEDNSSHLASMVFETGIAGSIKKELRWPIDRFLSILKLAGQNNTSLKITQHGVLAITVDAPHGEYTYYLRAKR